MATVKDGLLMPGLKHVHDIKASNYFEESLYNEWWIEPCDSCNKHVPQTKARHPVTDYSSFECNLTSYYCDDCYEIFKY
tara:strand:- start:49 stop:285 length:237 start_codon:yes stop_codon:yes gene_type:complete